MDRVSFIESIGGIEYPEMIVKFFDHFLALKEIVNKGGSVSLSNQQLSDPSCISFNIRFSDPNTLNDAIKDINQRSVINIYNRPISVNLKVLSEKELMIILK